MQSTCVCLSFRNLYFHFTSLYCVWVSLLTSACMQSFSYSVRCYPFLSNGIVSISQYDASAFSLLSSLFFFFSFLYRYHFSRRAPNWVTSNVLNTFRAPYHRIIIKWRQWLTSCVAWAGAIYLLYTKKAITASRWVCIHHYLTNMRDLLHWRSILRSPYADLFPTISFHRMQNVHQQH